MMASAVDVTAIGAGGVTESEIVASSAAPLAIVATVFKRKTCTEARWIHHEHGWHPPSACPEPGDTPNLGTSGHEGAEAQGLPFP
jgi:hypothetical protein